MTGIEKYLAPGILEDYCLGLLSDEETSAITLAAKDSPVLLQRIKEFEQALISYSTADASEPLKERILNTLETLAPSAKIDIADPPLIDRNSILHEWNEAVRDLQPDTDYGAIKVKFIKDTPDLQLCVAWLHNMLDETEHHADEFAESFFILEGSCECNIGGQLIHLKAGDYLDIPFDTHHTIRSTSPGPGYVKAVLQRRRTAA